MKRRPQNMTDEQNLLWIKDNEVEFIGECWVAKDSRCIGKDFRPMYYWKGRSRLMYHVTWENLYKSPFPTGKQARHLCSNTRCINPEHIEPGTAQENEKDKIIKNTKSSSLIPTPVGLSDEDKLEYWLNNHCKKVMDCYIWLGSTGSDGYARRNVGGVKVAVHRWIYSILNNKEYKDSTWFARHICNNRNCINPEHIIEGTRSDNGIDMRSYSKATKLTEYQVRSIIEDYLKKDFNTVGSKKIFVDEWAEKMNVGPDAIRNIVFRRRNWKDVLAEYGL